MTARRRVSLLRAGTIAERADTVVVEEPLEIRVNGSPLAVTMRTPGSDVELAQGFLLTEGVIGNRDDITSVRYCAGAVSNPGSLRSSPPEGDGLNTYNVLDVTLSAETAPPRPDVTRNFYTTSSCGVCGKASLEAVRLNSRHACGDDPVTLPATTLAGLPDRLRTAQKVFATTGGLHGAALFGTAGELLVAREDVGRHNAVD